MKKKLATLQSQLNKESSSLKSLIKIKDFYQYNLQGKEWVKKEQEKLLSQKSSKEIELTKVKDDIYDVNLKNFYSGSKEDIAQKMWHGSKASVEDKVRKGDQGAKYFKKDYVDIELYKQFLGNFQSKVNDKIDLKKLQREKMDNKINEVQILFQARSAKLSDFYELDDLLEVSRRELNDGFTSYPPEMREIRSLLQKTPEQRNEIDLRIKTLREDIIK